MRQGGARIAEDTRRGELRKRAEALKRTAPEPHSENFLMDDTMAQFPVVYSLVVSVVGFRFNKWSPGWA